MPPAGSGETRCPRIRLVVLRSAGSPDIRETFERHPLAEGVSPEEFLAEASSGTPASPPADVVRGLRPRSLMASNHASAMTGVMANVTCGFWVDV